jgi:hypothetical protein
MVGWYDGKESKMIAVESTVPLEIGSVVRIGFDEWGPRENSCMGRIARAITQREYIEFNREADPEFEDNRHLYAHERWGRFHYLAEVD